MQKIFVFNVFVLYNYYVFYNTLLMPETNSSRSQYDSPTKNRIVGAIMAGAKISEVSAEFGIPWSTVNDIWKKFVATGSTHNAPRSGRPPKATPRVRRRLVRIVKKNRRLPLREVAKLLSPQLSTSTIRNVLASEGFHRRKARRVPYLSRAHKQQRAAWAKPIAQWTMEQFSKIIWSDECYVHIGGNPGSVYVSRRPDEADLEECSAPTFEQSSVKVMVWACAMLDSKGPLIVLDFPGGKGGGMNSDRYQEQVLNGKLLDYYTEKSVERGLIFFQQDNARCHTSKSTMYWLNRHGIKTFPHPPSSPDMNPMENIWWELKRRIRALPRTPTSVEELKRAVVEVWNSLSLEDINKYVRSMPQRVQSVIAAHGGNTRF